MEIVTLCQKLERLHPFVDGNARTFGVHLLNHLLVQNGLDISTLDDPNILDGHGVEEIVRAVREGQARTADWRNEPAMQGGQGRSLQARLLADMGAPAP